MSDSPRPPMHGSWSGTYPDPMSNPVTLSQALIREPRAVSAISAGHFVAGLVGLAIAGSIALGCRAADRHDGASLAPPPAQDSLVQFVDLNRIARFHAVDDQTVIVTDDQGRDFTMQLTAPCPSLE